VKHEAVQDVKEPGVEKPLHAVAVPAGEEAQLLEGKVTREGKRKATCYSLF
jgi:hypothetical protein